MSSFDFSPGGGVRMWRRRALRSAGVLAIVALAFSFGCSRAQPWKTASGLRTSSPSTVTASDVTATVQKVDIAPGEEATALAGASALRSPRAIDEGTLLGVFKPEAPFDMSALDAYLRTTGRKPAILMWYQPWASGGMHQFDAGACVETLRRGAIPMITWEPWDPGRTGHDLRDPANQPEFKLANIAGGSYDDYIRSWARGVRSVRGPVMIRPMHEMNGTWYPWCGTVNGNSPRLYVRAWRHIHDIFVQEGATNVRWIWSVNRASMPGTPGFGAYYPGDEYVDWTAVSGFNFGRTPKTTWHSFDFLYSGALAYLETLRKPIAISEIGCVESGDDKQRWIADAYARIAEHPAVRAVVWYDFKERTLDGTHDFRIDSSRGTLSAFRRATREGHFRASPAPDLAAWTRSLTAADWRSLEAMPHVY